MCPVLILSVWLNDGNVNFGHPLVHACSCLLSTLLRSFSFAHTRGLSSLAGVFWDSAFDTFVNLSNNLTLHRQ